MSDRSSAPSGMRSGGKSKMYDRVQQRLIEAQKEEERLKKNQKLDAKRRTHELAKRVEKQEQERRISAGEEGVDNKKLMKREILGSMQKGGKVKQTGAYNLHKGEIVLPAKVVKNLKKLI